VHLLIDRRHFLVPLENRLDQFTAICHHFLPPQTVLQREAQLSLLVVANLQDENATEE
jgi:hypothetical protein